jgi:hypothetical protein
MTTTYYLFIDKEFCIRNVFQTLKMNILEPGIKYKEIKEHVILPPYIVLETIYQYGYLLETLKEEFENIGYDKSFEILKPF